MTEPATEVGANTVTPDFGGRSRMGRYRPRARRAGFLDTLDSAAGETGMATLANQGHDAHAVSGELNQIARGNTPQTARTMKRAARRHNFVNALFCVLFLACLGLVARAAINGTLRSDPLAIGAAAVAVVGAIALVASRGRWRRKQSWY
jgi:hypothetical protein